MTEFAWHVHHNVLVEPLVAPIEERIRVIENDKPPGERALRLRLLKPVRGKLPQAYVQAEQAYVQAEQAYDQAWQAYDQARQAYDQARQAYDQARQAYDQARQDPAVLALHAIECPDCPWDPDAHTIFP